MIKKSEFIVCGVAAAGLLAYSVAHHIDPLVASQQLGNIALQTTISGLKTAGFFLLQAAKATSVVVGTYAAIKITAVTTITIGKRLSARCRKRYQLNEIEEDNGECQEDVIVASTIDLEDSDDEDYDPADEIDDDFIVEAEDKLTQDEIDGLLQDQKRVIFYHGAERLPELKPIEDVYQIGPYSLRP